MPISDKDLEYMKKIAVFYRANGSIKRTADEFKINRNKVRKILVTMGEIKSPIADNVRKLREEGLSIQEIAKYLNVSVATVSTALPYEDKVDNTLEPTEHAVKVREYRAYEKKLKMQMIKPAKTKEDEPMKGDAMEDKSMKNKTIKEARSDKETIAKEWEKDIKMSYTEDYTRPPRVTWEEREEQLKALSKAYDRHPSKELASCIRQMSPFRPGIDTKEKELKKLLNKKKRTEEESKRFMELVYELGLFPGALNDRDKDALEKISGDRLPPDPLNVVRLHMELYDEYEEWYEIEDGYVDKDAEVFKKYGKLQYGNHISRDIVVPYDIPLYALHYVIQRAFGWENSHLHQFKLPPDAFKKVTKNKSGLWCKMVGILFRSPYMNEEDEFWCDDYNGGSFKNWLRKKYTGPYLSQCQGEGILSCINDMKRIDLNAKYYVLYSNAYNHKTNKYDGEEYVSRISLAYDSEGNKMPEPTPIFSDEAPYRVDIMDFKDAPVEGLRKLFDRDPMSLLERLPLYSVLAVGKYTLPTEAPKEEKAYIKKQIAKSGDAIYKELKVHIDYIVKEQINAPEYQVHPQPVTDTLIYSYDFGDNWKIRITASENCEDLVVSERITQTELDRANVKCREVYRPVLIAKDGEMLVDDVGGIHGFADFLEEINPELEGLSALEKKEAKEKKKESLTWAKSLGWHRESLSDFNLI